MFVLAPATTVPEGYSLGGVGCKGVAEQQESERWAHAELPLDPQVGASKVSSLKCGCQVSGTSGHVRPMLP